MNIEYYLEEVINTLNSSEVNLMALSRDTGVSYTLLRELKAGRHKNCTVSTLSAISNKLLERAPDKKCHECKFYDSFEDGSYYCHAHGGGSDKPPTACYVHQLL